MAVKPRHDKKPDDGRGDETMDRIAELVKRAQALNNAGDAGDAWSRHCGGISWREAGDRARALAKHSSVEEVNAEMARRGIPLQIF